MPNVKLGGNYLSQVTTEIKPKPRAIVAYGPPGIGKTSMFAHAPKPVFLSHAKEQGIHELKLAGIVPESVAVLPDPDHWQQTLDTLDELATLEHPFQWLIVDSLYWFQHDCFRHCCNENYKGDMTDKGFYSFQKGPKTAAQRYWPEFIEKLEACRDNNLNIVCLAHAEIKPYSNPLGPDYDKIIPNLEKTSFAAFEIWAESILFMNSYVSTEKLGAKVKAKQDAERYIYTQNNPAYSAKNRLGLPDIIEMAHDPKTAWENFEAELEEALDGE